MTSDEMKLNSEQESRADESTRRTGHGWRNVALLLLLVVALAEAAYIFRTPLARVFRREPTQGETVARSASVEPKAAGERKILYWQDPMHPQYRSDKPGKAPDCGMDLVPVYEGGDEAAPSLPEGSFRISPEKQQLIGVRYSEVTFEPLARTLRAVARLAYDETRITHVHSKIEGWIERVYVDFTGKLVEKEQPLLSIYSPELVATQEEYLLALRARERLGESSFKDVAAGAQSLLEAARRRLELWDVTAAQIAELEKTKKPSKAVTLYSTQRGFVIARNAFERQKITPETDLYVIADLSTIWAIVDIFEYEAGDVRLGQPVGLSLSYLPGRVFRGKISWINPQVDPTTRTLKVRAELANPDYALKPDMYADAELRIDYGRRLVVPQEAVLDSGSEKLVFVSHEDGYFEPRRIQLAARVDNRVVVLSGLKAGERIVSSGNFLVDSESRLKAAIGEMGAPAMDHSQHAHGAAPPKPVDHSQHLQAAPQAVTAKPADQPQDKKKQEQHRHD